MFLGSSQLSFPLGPSTRIWVPFSTATLTLSGSVIGVFPIRDMSVDGLPDVGEEFSSDILFARLVTREYAAGG